MTVLPRLDATDPDATMLCSAEEMAGILALAERRRREAPTTLLTLLDTTSSLEIWHAVAHGPGGFERPVVARVLRRHLVGDEEAEARLLARAKALARLNHPNVARIYDLRRFDGRLGIISQHVDGMSLDRLLVRGPLPPRAGLELLAGVATGLAAVHKEGAPASGTPGGGLHLPDIRVTSDARVVLTHQAALEDSEACGWTPGSRPARDIGRLARLCGRVLLGVGAPLRRDALVDALQALDPVVAGIVACALSPEGPTQPTLDAFARVLARRARKAGGGGLEAWMQRRPQPSRVDADPGTVVRGSDPEARTGLGWSAPALCLGAAVACVAVAVVAWASGTHFAEPRPAGPAAQQVVSWELVAAASPQPTAW